MNVKTKLIGKFLKAYNAKCKHLNVTSIGQKSEIKHTVTRKKTYFVHTFLVVV